MNTENKDLDGGFELGDGIDGFDIYFQKSLSNWPAIEESLWAKEYIEGRLTLVIYFNVSIRCEADKGNCVSNDSGVISGKRAALSITSLQGDSDCFKTGKEKLVLIDNVCLVESPQGRVPSLIRFYLVKDNVGGGRTALLYHSVMSGAYKFFRAGSNGEMYLSEFSAAPLAGLYNSVSGMVESRPEIVESITEAEYILYRKCIESVYTDNFFPSFRVSIDENSIGVGINPALKECIQVTDMFVGPLDL